MNGVQESAFGATRGLYVYAYRYAKSQYKPRRARASETENDDDDESSRRKPRACRGGILPARARKRTSSRRAGDKRRRDTHPDGTTKRTEHTRTRETERGGGRETRDRGEISRCVPPSSCYFSRDNKNYRLSELENNRSSWLPPDRGLHSLRPDTQAVATGALIPAAPVVYSFSPLLSPLLLFLSFFHPSLLISSSSLSSSPPPPPFAHSASLGFCCLLSSFTLESLKYHLLGSAESSRCRLTLSNVKGWIEVEVFVEKKNQWTKFRKMFENCKNITL